MTSPRPIDVADAAELGRLIEDALDAVVVVVDGTVAWANRSAVDQLGGERAGGVVGHDFDELARRARVDGERRTLALRVGGRPASLVVVSRGPAEEEADRVSALAHAATHDALTGLPNRALLLDRLGHALDRHRRREETVAVIFLDLDRFKKVNDTMGHRAGDELLVAASRRLQQVLRPSDTVARFGGDEFVVVCEGLLGEIEAIGIADRIREVLERPFRVANQTVFVSASLGIASPRSEGEDPEALLADADAAMFRAKEQGRGRSQPYDRRMRERARERLETEMALRAALEEDGLRLVYQPIVELASGDLIGLEALTRWDRSPGVALAAGELISVAEEAGLIDRVGGWALGEAFRRQAAWEHDAVALGVAAPVTSVNVSALQLGRPELMATVEAALDDSGVNPSHIWLEITESAVIHEPAAALATLRSLRGLGLRLAVDDFGTGWASLSALRRFPFDVLKIDGSFVAGMSDHPHDRSIVAAVLRLADELGLQAVAEGIETGEQRDMLVDLGCRYGQGYLFAAPLDAEAVRARLGWRPGAPSA